MAVESWLDSLKAESEDIFAECSRYRDAYRSWREAGFLPEAEDLTVWDLECGHGAFSAVFVDAGARAVHASDSFLDPAALPVTFRAIERLQFHRAPPADAAKQVDPPDLIFFHTASEHVRNLAEVFHVCYQALKPGGFLFLNHDNYYQPVGHHDHGFLFLDPQSVEVVFQGVRCWDSDTKCQSSEEHRDSLLASHPHAWDRRMNARLDPADCPGCPYYRRAQPWAHLREQDRFLEVFPQEWFRSAGAEGALNKVTLFQLRQFYREAGFEVEKEGPFRLRNSIPDDLADRFSAEDLLTFQLTSLLRKPLAA